MIRPVYQYAARLLRVIDGDTYELAIDCGFYVWYHATIRLLGWDCPERRDPLGPAATAAAQQILSTAQTIIVRTEKDEQTFARWLARVDVDGVDMGLLLSQRGLATRLE